MMITMRQFFVTLLVFLILLLLFMGFQIGKDAAYSAPRGDQISEGQESAPRSPGFLKFPEEGNPENMPEQDNWVLFLGREDSAFAGPVREWACYTGTPVVLAQDCPTLDDSALPDLLMIEPEFVSGRSGQIAQWMEQGVDVVFLALPECGEIQADPALLEILGIHEIRQPEVQLHGIHLFQGFFLGGERIFEVEDDNDPGEKQDLELVLPWYSVRTGTKTFMRGILSEEDLNRALENKLENEDLPAIVWRNHFGQGEAYAVNGSYMTNRSIAIGMLQAMMYERSEYALYPVVNARLFTLANYPMLTDENREEVIGVYGRTVTKVQTDIIMPMLITLSSKYSIRPSCFMSVKYQWNDAQQPDSAVLNSCLSMLREMNGELALSLDYRGELSAEEKASFDGEFLQSEGTEYRLAAGLAACDALPEFPSVLNRAGFAGIRTVSTSDDSDEYPVIGYLNDEITCQQRTSDLTRHTFTDELELLGIQTLLAYSNGFYDMAHVFYPDRQEDEWQNISRVVFSNLTTYNNPFRMEDYVTATESDARIRTYLALEYDEVRNGDVVSVTISGASGGRTCYFILRTHDEILESMVGGSFEEIERNAYLISADQEKIELHLSSSLSDLVHMEGKVR